MRIACYDESSDISVDAVNIRETEHNIVVKPKMKNLVYQGSLKVKKIAFSQ